MKKLKDILFVIFNQLTFILFLLIFITINSKSQTITNGTFDMVPVGFGWNTSCVSLPYEMLPESVYGGPSGFNRVAEIDLGAGICQNVSGFIPGNSYILNFLGQRRLTSSPPPIVDINIIFGSLSAYATNSNTSWLPNLYSFTFIATSVMHTLSISAGPLQTSTRGFIIDNIQIVPTPLNLNFNNFNNNLLINKSITQNNFECKIIEEKYYDLLGNELFIKPKEQYFILHIVKKCGQEIILINKKIIIYER